MTTVPTGPPPLSTGWVDDPLHVDGRSMTAQTDEDGWIHDLILAVLLTSPGERVHRPDFGSGLLQLVFAPDSPELLTTVQFLVQGALQQWVGHLVEVNQVGVVATGDADLTITVAYTVRRTGRQRLDRFSTGGAP